MVRIYSPAVLQKLLTDEQFRHFCSTRKIKGSQKGGIKELIHRVKSFGVGASYEPDTRAILSEE